MVPETQVGVSRVLFQTPDGTIYYGLVDRSELKVSHYRTMEHEIAIGGPVPFMPADDVNYLLDVECRKMYQTKDFGVALDFLAGGRPGWPTKEEQQHVPAEPKIVETQPDEWEQVEI